MTANSPALWELYIQFFSPEKAVLTSKWLFLEGARWKLAMTRGLLLRNWPWGNLFIHYVSWLFCSFYGWVDQKIFLDSANKHRAFLMASSILWTNIFKTRCTSLERGLLVFRLLISAHIPLHLSVMRTGFFATMDTDQSSSGDFVSMVLVLWLLGPVSFIALSGVSVLLSSLLEMV
jgi:hypothetical protein